MNNSYYFAEYLLGDEILVAPVTQEGAVTRDIYLPSGKWKDGNSDIIHVGPKKIDEYEAPLDVLPYFLAVKTN